MHSTSFVGLLDYSLCFIRDKCLNCQLNNNFQIVIKKISVFRNKCLYFYFVLLNLDMQKFFKAFVSIYHFISNNPDILLPENYLEKFERLCSTVF